MPSYLSYLDIFFVSFLHLFFLCTCIRFVITLDLRYDKSCNTSDANRMAPSFVYVAGIVVCRSPVQVDVSGESVAQLICQPSVL